jgi:hypothetical protein
MEIKMENIMKSKTKLFVIFVTVSCLITISSADVGIGISEVGTISSITGIEAENISPGEFTLSQNYPTPSTHQLLLNSLYPNLNLLK